MHQGGRVEGNVGREMTLSRVTEGSGAHQYVSDSKKIKFERYMVGTFRP